MNHGKSTVYQWPKIPTGEGKESTTWPPCGPEEMQVETRQQVDLLCSAVLPDHEKEEQNNKQANKPNKPQQHQNHHNPPQNKVKIHQNRRNQARKPQPNTTTNTNPRTKPQEKTLNEQTNAQNPIIQNNI